MLNANHSTLHPDTGNVLSVQWHQGKKQITTVELTLDIFLPFSDLKWTVELDLGE
jgi:hypothetical protein